MAYQTKSDEFFDFLHQLLVENKVNETIHLLSDATSVDATLHGDLKFLKLRVNKKLMVPAESVGGPPKDQIRDVIKLLGELKKAHNRRKVMVSTYTEPSKKGIKAIKKVIINKPKPTYSSTATASTTATSATVTATAPANPIAEINEATPKKKRAIWPWVLLLFLIGGGASGYFFKDKILQNEYVQKVIPEGWISEADIESNTTPVKNTSNKKTTTPKKTTSKPSKTSLGRWYIQIASYPTLGQALNKRKRVEMSFDRSVVLQKNLKGKPNYRVVIPGFSDKKAAESFKAERKVGKLHIGAFAQAFSRDCRDLKESESNIFICK